MFSYESLLLYILVVLHVVVGSVTLISQLMILFLRKGSRLHKKIGWVFVVFSLVTPLSGLWIEFLLYEEKPFLQMFSQGIPFLSFHLSIFHMSATFYGLLALKARRKDFQIKSFYKIPGFLNLLVTLFTIWGAYYFEVDYLKYIVWFNLLFSIHQVHYWGSNERLFSLELEHMLEFLASSTLAWVAFIFTFVGKFFELSYQLKISYAFIPYLVVLPIGFVLYKRNQSMF